VSREERECDCGHSLDGAIATNPDAVSQEARRRIETLAGHYLDELAGIEHDD